MKKTQETVKIMVNVHPEHLREESQWLSHSAKIWDRDQPHKKGANFKYLPLRDTDGICLLHI